ncbi:MAG: hypothetical protein NVSMB64_31760 [Candidatus Velthaea sp.]
MILAATAVASLLVFSESAQPTYAEAATSTAVDSTTSIAPVKIDNISIKHDAGKFPHYFYELAFRVTSTLVADEVHFVVRDGGRDAQIVDKGIFSPGILIAHRFFTPPSELPYRDSVSSTVTYVHFADGTHWEGRQTTERVQATAH